MNRKRIIYPTKYIFFIQNLDRCVTYKYLKFIQISYMNRKGIIYSKYLTNKIMFFSPNKEFVFVRITYFGNIDLWSNNLKNKCF